MSLGVAAAVSLYGISFGALAVASGLDFWQTQVLSLFMFSGGSQFAVIGLAATGAPGLSIVTAAGLLGVRNGLYAVRMSAVVGPGFWKRLLAGHWTIDESTAVAIAQTEPRAQRIGFWLTGAAIFVGWNAMTAAGAILGDALGDPRTWGLDAAAAAAFLGLLWPRIQSRQPAAVAAVAAVITVLTVPTAPAGLPVLIAAAAGIVMAILAERRHP
ncbi:MAG: branched-chain amino acid ABC transporter permease [Actinobacteria bacterium]|jgi:predicted branched-subunit amino acid permease|nr:branched-chain amino acid ABC transporter permease [Actinomycetota bacterium]